jgi:hypothetical protein
VQRLGFGHDLQHQRKRKKKRERLEYNYPIIAEEPS